MRARQRGAALAVGLMLLLVLTILAVSGMNTSTVELQMAGNMQYAQNAFQAAESGIEVAIAKPDELPTEPTLALTGVPSSDSDKYKYEVKCDADTGWSWSLESSIGETAVYHYDIVSTGESARGARSVHSQSYYFEGPYSGPCKTTLAPP